MRSGWFAEVVPFAFSPAISLDHASPPLASVSPQEYVHRRHLAGVFHFCTPAWNSPLALQLPLESTLDEKQGVREGGLRPISIFTFPIPRH